jgi:hypothetical protein
MGFTVCLSFRRSNLKQEQIEAKKCAARACAVCVCAARARTAGAWAIGKLHDLLAEKSNHQTPCETMLRHLSDHGRITNRLWQLALQFVIPLTALLVAGAVAFLK